jgi:hypothetical protein
MAWRADHCTESTQAVCVGLHREFKPSDYSMVVFGRLELYPAVFGENLQKSSQKITGSKATISDLQTLLG